MFFVFAPGVAGAPESAVDFSSAGCGVVDFGFTFSVSVRAVVCFDFSGGLLQGLQGVSSVALNRSSLYVSLLGLLVVSVAI